MYPEIVNAGKTTDDERGIPVELKSFENSYYHYRDTTR